MQNTPRLFISYSWSNPDHEQWVIDLATQLRDSGVDVVLDKWDLKEGHDSISFMEKMVVDPGISKVAIISDKTYAEKADGRAGGVGTETQIISREVYEKQNQDKFVAVLPTKDETGKPYLPTYYKGRIYIDLSESERYSENFEKLLRWIYDKPIYVKPSLGKPPAFLDETRAIYLGTSAILSRLLDAVRNVKPQALGTLDEYLKIYSENMERFRINLDGIPGPEVNEKVAESIDQFRSSKDEFAQVVTLLSQYLPNGDLARKLHRFFERILRYAREPINTSSWRDYDFDNFKFLVHEIFLYTAAILIRDEHFHIAAELLAKPYYVELRNRGGGETVSFTEFRDYMPSFTERSERTGRLSARADLLKNRAETSGIDFRALMQADFVLYIRAALQDSGRVDWWPETLVYATHAYGPFELFARASSKAYFENLKVLLGIASSQDLVKLADSFRDNDRRVPKWGWDRINPAALMGLENLASRP